MSLLQFILPYSYIQYLHLLIFSTQFGSMIWMSFIQGILLFKRLPKQQFSLIQSIVFPVYFIFCSLGITCMLTIQYNTTQYNKQSLYIYNLVGMLFMCLCNQLFIGPKTTEIMWRNHQIQRDNNKLTNTNNASSTLQQQPTLNKQFAIYHGISSLLNLLVVIGLVLHGVYLTNTLGNMNKRLVL